MGASAAIAVFALGTGMKAQAANQAGKNAQMVANYNAGVNEAKADDAIVRGRETEARHRIGTRKLIGSQRASFAAGGVVVGEADSTATNVEVNTATMSEADALTIRSNAAREAWGYRVGAQDDRLRGSIARAEGRNKATAEVVGGVGTVMYGMYGFG